MTNIKTFFGRLYYLDRAIRNKESELENMKEAAMSVRSPVLSKDKVKFRNRFDRLGDAVSKFIDYESELCADIRHYQAMRHEIINVIDNVENPRDRMILYKRYIEFKDWQSIADDMGISLRHVLRLHKNILGEFKK